MVSRTRLELIRETPEARERLMIVVKMGRRAKVHFLAE
jgi:hypothetical protein